MRNRMVSALGIWVLGALVGCGSSSSSTAGKNPSPDGPIRAVAEFLEAVRTGNNERMFAMLTDEAREGMQEKGLSPGMPATENSSFEVGEVEFVDGGAHVASRWKEAGSADGPESTEVLWILRQQTVGWRVAGMAMKVYDDLPVILNFEDPEEMIRKQALVDQEIARREQAGNDSTTAAPAGSKTR